MTDYSHIIYYKRCSSSYASVWWLINDDWLLMTDWWWLIIRKLIQLRKFLLLIVFTRKMRRTRIPQADGGQEHESSEFKRNLNGGPQADEVRIQVSINDDWLFASSSSYASSWLLIVFTRKMRRTRMTTDFYWFIRNMEWRIILYYSWSILLNEVGETVCHRRWIRLHPW